jgi:hypothetical protein
MRRGASIYQGDDAESISTTPFDRLPIATARRRLDNTALPAVIAIFP